MKFLIVGLATSLAIGMLATTFLLGVYERRIYNIVGSEWVASDIANTKLTDLESGIKVMDTVSTQGEGDSNGYWKEYSVPCKLAIVQDVHGYVYNCDETKRILISEGHE